MGKLKVVRRNFQTYVYSINRTTNTIHILKIWVTFFTYCFSSSLTISANNIYMYKKLKFLFIFSIVAFLHNQNRDLSSLKKEDKRISPNRRMNYDDNMVSVKKPLSEKDSKREYYNTISDASSSASEHVSCSCGRSSVVSSSPSVSRSCSGSGSPSNSESESGRYYNFC